MSTSDLGEHRGQSRETEAGVWSGSDPVQMPWPGCFSSLPSRAGLGKASPAPSASGTGSGARVEGRILDV